jgi:hypothetical protein
MPLDNPPAIECRYTLAEIDRMRAALYTLAAPYCSIPHEFITDQTGFETRIEEQLRTYLMACIKPEELETKKKAYLDKQSKPCGSP